jgi:exopolyphosphatase/pppGpp-phosphohydrolase
MEDQLSSMKLADEDDSKTHLTELKQHFQLMLQHRDNLIKIGSTMSDTRFNTIIMSLLPESYWPTLQTITASEQMSKLSGSQANSMKAGDLIAFIIEEAQHRVINDDCTKNAESALAACTKNTGKPMDKKEEKGQSDETCKNCDRPGHSKPDCWFKGGGKEGQAPWIKKSSKKPETVVVAVDDKEGDLFAFTCTLDYTAATEKINVLKTKMGTGIHRGAR